MNNSTCRFFFFLCLWEKLSTTSYSFAILILLCVSSFLFFFFPFWPPCGIWSSQSRDQIQATTATYAAAEAMLDP